VIVVAQTPEVVEGDHLQVWPGVHIWQLFADAGEDAFVAPSLCNYPDGQLFLVIGNLW